MTPILEADIVITKCTDIDEDGQEEAQSKRNDLEPSHVILDLTVDNDTESSNERKEYPEDQYPSPVWHFLFWYPEL